MEYTSIKRLMDLTFSIIFLILFSPILIFLIIVLIPLTKNKPLYIQYRPGKNEKLFIHFKLRSMTMETDDFGNMLEDEKRLRWWGRILRKTSLDELPQLINVLMGDMSLIGPRPLLIDYLKLYNKTQMRRHEIKPGITGWAQVNGRNSISWEEKFKLDVWYVDNFSFWLDIKILLLTLIMVFQRTGINQDGQATREKFTGYN